jgi:NAD(P)-dependent dehydrogenase (short-subunit alcohol dehydrogenase family)
MKKALLFGSAAACTAGIIATRLLRRTMDFRGKVVLITGGSRGLGLGLAREFGRRGAHLVLCARSLDELERARQRLETSGRVVAIPCDVTDREQVNQLISRTLEEFGALDVLVNNAGVISSGPIETMTIEDFEEAMDVMFWGMVYTTLAALPHFRARHTGAIVNVTSIGGKVSVPHLVPYSCAKFAGVAFSEGIAAELKGSGIRVVTIAPGLMRTGSFVNARFKGAERGEAAWFSAGASIPGISMSAARAARQIVRALERGRSERILSTPANLMARFHGLFPETTIAVLGLVNRLLPHGSQRVEIGAESPILARPWMKAVTALGRRAAEEYLQPALPE